MDIKNTEFSAGAIIFREEKGKRIYLIIKNFRGEWGFPKGHIEKTDKGPEDAARREILEETGISKFEFVYGHREELAYRYEKNGEMHDKISIYYLAKTKEKKIKCKDNEIVEFKWLHFKEAIKKLTFENSKGTLDNAERRMTEGI